MNTAGHLEHPASELRAIRRMQPWAFVATFAGTLVLAAIMGLNLDAVPELPAKISLGVSIPVFFAAALAAMSARPGSAARRPGPRPDDATPVAADDHDMHRPSDDERVQAWRRTRLAALGVPEDVALVLAEQPSFSLHELKQLLADGCPLGTALRILWPA